MNTTTPQFAVISNKTYEAKKIVHQNYHGISSALQTTLDFYKLIPLFTSKIEKMVYHSAYVYTNPEFKLEIKQGVFTRNACSYALKFENQQLGTLKLMRNSEFHERELELLESLLCCLIYPLNNATLYQRAAKMAYGNPLETKLEIDFPSSDAFGQAFSRGVNAQIEYNRKQSEKANAQKQKSQYDYRDPWAVGFHR